MKVLFILRSDGQKKPGGDSSKVARYKKYLEAKGHTVEVFFGIPCKRKLNSADLFHLMNLDLPLENFHYSKKLKKFNKPIVLSSISTQSGELRNFIHTDQTPGTFSPDV